MNVDGFIPVAGDNPVAVMQPPQLNDAPPALERAFHRRFILCPARVRKIEYIGIPLIHHHIAMAAYRLVVKALAGLST